MTAAFVVGTSAHRRHIRPTMKRLPLAAALLSALALALPAPAAKTTSIDGVEPNPNSFVAPTEGTHEPVPPPPAGFILDQAQVFLPEAATRLSTRLTAARASEVYIYVVTFRSLGVAKSKQEERLHARAKDFTQAWLPGKVGALLLFDDEGGLMAVDLTPETDRRFTSFAVEDSLRDPIHSIQQSGLARDKLEHAATTLADILVPLQDKWVAATHSHRLSNFIMGAVALLGLGLAVFSASAKPKASAGSVTAPTVPEEPHADF